MTQEEPSSPRSCPTPSLAWARPRAKSTFAWMPQPVGPGPVHTICPNQAKIPGGWLPVPEHLGNIPARFQLLALLGIWQLRVTDLKKMSGINYPGKRQVLEYHIQNNTIFVKKNMQKNIWKYIHQNLWSLLSFKVISSIHLFKSNDFFNPTVMWH